MIWIILVTGITLASIVIDQIDSRLIHLLPIAATLILVIQHFSMLFPVMKP
jgi:hypothetical protein